MKISKLILTFATILLLLCGIALVFPKDGVQIGNLKLSFPTFKDLFSFDNVEYADIETIVEDDSAKNNTDNSNNQVKIKENNITDIVFPQNNPHYLDKFFASLDNIEAHDNKVRVVHYGDSQIEGDRITSYLRTRLQNEFGGKGQGEIPLHSLSNIKNINFAYSDNLNFYSIIDLEKHNFSHYGIMQSAVIPNNEDQAYIKLSFAKPVSGEITLYYGNHSENSNISFVQRGETLSSYDLDNEVFLSKLSVNITKPTKSLMITTKGFPELYSLDFSDKSGVYVDNVSLRGSSGYGFTKNNGEFLSRMNDMLNVRLVILQFGVNAVPQDEQTVMPSYNFYKVRLKKQVDFIKRVNPNASIIIVGISDRSRKKSDAYETNPNIPMILAVQKQVAEECGVAFWNLFEAMGGNNSMPSWVLRDKPLANKDFTHFNETGAKYVGEMFYKALENAYNNYKAR